MKILIYSDVHICKTSSILPLSYNNTNYTYRQDMIIKTAQWLSKLATNYKPDLIVNLGDTFDQHTLTSYDIEIARKFFNEFADIDINHLILVGNHEMINNHYNAVALLNNINNITVINEPCSIDFEVNNTITQLAFLPYRHTKDIIDFPKGEFLFSHNDIYGSKIRNNIKLETGISRNILQQKYKLVFNGHIHKSDISENVVNVGSCTTHSFADDNDWQPHAYIFNTETMNLETFNNLSCPLFKVFEVTDLIALSSYLDKLDNKYKYILHINCPFEIKDKVKEMLNRMKTTINRDIEQDQEFIVNYKISTKIIDKKLTNLDRQNPVSENTIFNDLDCKEAFKKFLNTIDLKFPTQMYYDVLDKEVEKENEN